MTHACWHIKINRYAIHIISRRYVKRAPSNSTGRYNIQFYLMTTHHLCSATAALVLCGFATTDGSVVCEGPARENRRDGKLCFLGSFEDSYFVSDNALWS
jgi:hypothetical protein